MEELEILPSDPEPSPSPVRPRLRRGGGMSAESLVASFLLHLAALFLVIVYAPGRPDREHDSVLIDIADFVLPEAPPQAPPSLEPPKAEAPSPAPSVEAPVEIPAKDAAASAEPPQSPVKPQVEEAKAEPPEAEEAKPAVAAAAPPVPESPLPHRHGEYDPFELYKAALAERVNEVMVAALDSFPILRAFRGKLVVHLYLDPQGRPRWFRDQAGLFIRGGAICLHHKGYQIESVMPMPGSVFQRHCEALDQYVVRAINEGAPYPAPPPGLEIPDELSYVFDLPGSSSEGVQPATVPRVGPSVANQRQ